MLATEEETIAKKIDSSEEADCPFRKLDYEGKGGRMA